MPPRTDAPITDLLERWHAGDASALDALAPLVYAELHKLAANQLRRERAAPFAPAELVHELVLRLAGAGRASVDWRDRAHFFAVAAKQMRHVLVDEARRRGRGKRGGAVEPVTLTTDVDVADGASSDVLALHDALDALAARDARKAQAVELHYFGGLDYAAVGAVLGVSEATIDRDLRFAKAWLRHELAA